MYIGVNTGDFYALDSATGTVVWKRFLGFASKRTCGRRGITSTASVTPGSTGELMVYVGGGDGYRYALNASDGSITWRARVVKPGGDANEGYKGSSPVVIGGHV